MSKRLRNNFVVATTAALLSACLVMFLSSTLDETRAIERATMIRKGETTEVALPRFWRAANSEVTSTTFELQFDSREYSLFPNDAYLFLPFFEQRIFLRVNGLAVKSDNLEEPIYSPLAYSYALQKIPPTVLREGKNNLEIRVETGPGRFGALPKVYVGSKDLLQLPYSLFSFSTFEFRILLLGAEVILGFFALLMYRARREDAVYGWLSAALLGSTLSNASIFVDLFPVLKIFSLSSYLLLPAVGLPILGFALALNGISATRRLIALTILIPTFSVVLNSLLNVSPDAVFFYLTVPSLFFPVILAGILIMLASVRSGNNHTDVLSISLLIIAQALIYDTGVRVGFFPTGIPVSVFARFFVLLGVIIFLMRRWSANAKALDHAAQELKEKLAAREKSLREAFELQNSTLQKIAKSEERQRITVELHDGVAGHLITILALLDSEQQDREPIRKTTRLALDELRTVIDMLVVNNTSLEFTLASFREKCLDPLEKTGMEIIFDTELLSEEIALSPTESLNLFRLLQEATTNAKRHGQPRRIAIRASFDDQIVRLAVENEGGKSLGDYVEGFGLRNIRKRCASLRQGTFNLNGTQTGAVLTIEFPSTAQAESYST